MSNLPCNLRDDKWLARMFQFHCGLSYIEFNKIYDFVKTSPIFKEERNAYEQRIVKWQIEYMLGGGDGWLVDKEYGGDFINMDSRCDIGFRNGVVKTLSAIGMDRKAIEEGIEVNASLWRIPYMKRAFRNEFNGMFLVNLEPTEKEHEEAWLRMRLYEYYQAHKLSVDKYGIVTPEMQMSDEEVSVVSSYLKEKNRERTEYLEKCKNDPDKQLDFHVDFGFDSGQSVKKL